MFIVFIFMILQIWYFCNSTWTVQHNGIMDCGRLQGRLWLQHFLKIILNQI